MNTNQVSTDQIDQIFLRCQPKQQQSNNNNNKKQKQKRMLNKAKVQANQRLKNNKNKVTANNPTVTSNCTKISGCGNIRTAVAQRSVESSDSDIDSRSQVNNHNHAELNKSTPRSRDSSLQVSSHDSVSPNNTIGNGKTNTKSSKQNVSSSKSFSNKSAISSPMPSSNVTQNNKRPPKYNASKKLRMQIKGSKSQYKKLDKQNKFSNSNKDSAKSASDEGNNNNEDKGSTIKTNKSNETLDKGHDRKINDDVDENGSENQISSINNEELDTEVKNIDSLIESNNKLSDDINEDSQIMNYTSNEISKSRRDLKSNGDDARNLSDDHEFSVKEDTNLINGFNELIDLNKNIEMPNDVLENTKNTELISNEIDKLQISQSCKKEINIHNDIISKTDTEVTSEILFEQTDECKLATTICNDAHIMPKSFLQFDALSDNESIPDESPKISNISSISAIPKNECISLSSSNLTKTKSRTYVPTHQSKISETVRPCNDEKSQSKLDSCDDSPIRSTPFAFPKLDEGLSSEAESCYEDSNEDDEKAADGDVDDDDDYDDQDDPDDDNDELEGTVSNILSFCEPDSLSRNPSKTVHNRLNTSNIQIPSTTNLPIYASADALQFEGNSLKQHTNGFIDQQAILDHVKNDYFVGNHSNDLTKSHITNVFNDQNLPNSSQSSTGYWLNQQQSTINIMKSCQTDQRNSNNNNTNKTLHKVTHIHQKDDIKTNLRASSDTDTETDRLLGSQRNEQAKINKNLAINNKIDDQIDILNKKASTSQQEGTTQLECIGRTEKNDRAQQAQMAVHEVRSRADSSTSAEVQLFISTEKIMILDNERQKIATTFDLKTISYIADIDEYFVLIVREYKKNELLNDVNRHTYKLSCHVFESNESHTITKSIDQAFKVAYAELRKVHGLSDNYLSRENDLQEVLNSQEMSFEELEMFACKDNHREVIVPKKMGEMIGISIVESGWGSMLPTVVVASLKSNGPAYKCKELSIGDQILSVNGNSLVGLSLFECQEFLRKTRNHTAARLVVVPCPITVDVKIKRPDTKYQLGFSVQNGVICSLLRGGIAERGGVRVGHRIMSINGTPVVGVPHEKIVSLLASSVGEIRMKTCLTSLYRLILGEDKPTHL